MHNKSFIVRYNAVWLWLSYDNYYWTLYKDPSMYEYHVYHNFVNPNILFFLYVWNKGYKIGVDTESDL